MSARVFAQAPNWNDLRAASRAEPCARLGPKMALILSVLEAAEPGNVASACRQVGVSRPTFYKWKREFVAFGADAEALRRVAQGKVHPLYTTPAQDERLCELGEEFPNHSHAALGRMLAKEGILRSSVTVRHSLLSYGLGRDVRPRKAERDGRLPFWQPDENQMSVPPEGSTPDATALALEELGSSLVQSVFFVRTGTFLGTVYVHAVVDPCSGFVWAHLCRDNSNGAREAALVLQDVIALYSERGQSIAQVTTSARREFRGAKKQVPFFSVLYCVAREAKERERDYLDGEREAAGVDEHGAVRGDGPAPTLGTSVRHRTFEQFLLARGIRHEKPPQSVDRRRGYTASFNKDFALLAVDVRDLFFAPWRTHQHKRPCEEEFAVLCSHFADWLKRYNASYCLQRAASPESAALRPPGPDLVAPTPPETEFPSTLIPTPASSDPIVLSPEQSACLQEFLTTGGGMEGNVRRRVVRGRIVSLIPRRP